MNPLIHPKAANLPFLIALLLTCFGHSSTAWAVVPPPDGGYPGFNTAEGNFALQNLTTGTRNTAIGFQTLFTVTTGSQNTAVGSQALKNSTANRNTANGFQSLGSNTTGRFNTASGATALFKNTTGERNMANGDSALYNNTSGDSNTANGVVALFRNTIGNGNTASGDSALYHNTSGNENTASGVSALANNSIGHSNTAVGAGALFDNTIGDFNVALGVGAGENLTTGNDNIDIDNPGVAGESGTIRIGLPGIHTRAFVAGIQGVAVSGMGVFVTASGQLGVTASSRRFKDNVQPMGDASEAILALKPVTFHYAKDIDPNGTDQFGLIAEEVEKVNPKLVVRGTDGKAYTVRYDAVNAMLLNEFLKEHRKNEEQEATIAELKAEIATLSTTVKEQASEMQKVRAQLELNKPAPQTVSNTR
jgi:Chaperone of endosialidase